MNISIKKHLIDLLPILTLGGIFKAVIIPAWDNVNFSTHTTIDLNKSILLILGYALVMVVLYAWHYLLNRKDKKPEKALIQYLQDRKNQLQYKIDNSHLSGLAYEIYKAHGGIEEIETIERFLK